MLLLPGDCLQFKQYKWLFFRVRIKLSHRLTVSIEQKTFNCIAGRCRRSLSPICYKKPSLQPVIPTIVPVLSSLIFLCHSEGVLPSDSLTASFAHRAWWDVVRMILGDVCILWGHDMHVWSCYQSFLTQSSGNSMDINMYYGISSGL